MSYQIIKKIESQYDPKYLFLDGDDYSAWSGNEEELTKKKNRLINKNLKIYH